MNPQQSDFLEELLDADALEPQAMRRVPGLRLITDFVTEEAEIALIEAIDRQPWSAELKRRVQHYGFKYDYRARAIEESMRLGPLPQWLDSLGERLARERIFAKQPDQAIANEYLPGQGISMHTDCEPCFGDTIASLTLASGCAMEFFRVDRRGTKLSLFLPRRSLLVLRGKARYDWRHGIPARKSDSVEGQRRHRGRRVSLTFRAVVRPETV